MFVFKERDIGTYDVCVAGGGVAGACAAIAAARGGARVALVEPSGSLGGTLTEGFMPMLIDMENKGGLVRELYAFLNAHGMTLAKRGARTDEQGRRIPGEMVDTEGCKVFFDRLCREAGVTVLFYSRVCGVETNGRTLSRVMLSTEGGMLTLAASLFVDATGGGALSDLAGCAWACGDPETGHPSPLSLSVCTVGMPKTLDGTDCISDKDAYAAMLKEHGITVSSEQVSVKRLPSLSSWNMGMNFEYGVLPDDILALSRANAHAREEIFTFTEAQRSIDGFEDAFAAFTGAHIGVREGRRVYGDYRLTDADILEGRRFPDGICLVTAGVDVHKLHATDTLDCVRGVRSQPYHIPYRALIARDMDNLFLAGRCLSGDFYPHASYRMMGNMAATGEAVGFAAAQCVKQGKLPREVDGTQVRAFMHTRGYEL